MPILTVIAIVIFAGYAIYTRVYTSPPKLQNSADGTVLSTDTTQSSPSPAVSPKVSPSPTAKTSVSSGTSKIDIKVDSTIGNTTPTSEKIVYPGASQVGGNRYETATDPDAVYNWYKGELEKRTFQIRNNVKTRANDKFKAILQGVAGSISIKVTIEQENAGAKTVMTLE